MSDLLTGGCNCGAVRFEVTEPLVSASYCHCRRCQRRTGAAASANAHPAPGAVRVVAGEQALRAWKPEEGLPKAFCAECGGQLYSEGPDFRVVRLGAVDGDPGIRPEWHQWLESAPDWEPIPDDGLPRFQQRRR